MNILINRKVCLATGLLSLACLGQGQPASAQTAAKSFNCLMEAQVVIKLGAEVTGLIKRVTVDRGDLVKAGQVVATLEAGVQEAVVALARLRAANEFQIRSQQAKRDYLSRKNDRVQTLQRQAIASTASLDEVSSDLKIAENAAHEAELSQAIARLELERETQVLAQRQIKSPIDGIVTERALFAGEYRHESNHFLTIAQIDPLNVEVFLPVAHYGRLALGAKAIVKPEEPVGGTYEAKVIVIDQLLDAASGTFGIRLQLPNPGNRLPAGTRCNVMLPGLD